MRAAADHPALATASAAPRTAIRPEVLFWGFVALHATLWTVLPALLYANPPLDIIEALVMGREWQLGYAKLPPLPWWVVEAVRTLAGERFWPLYLTAQVFVGVAFWAVWRLGRALLPPTAALIAVAALSGLHYLGFTAPKFNHDVAQLPFWALTGLSLWRALRFGRTADWLLLGVWLAGAFWAKYFFVVLAAPLVLFVLVERDARRHLATPGPWLAAAVALALAAPHLWWLVAHDFLPFVYADARATPSRGLLDHVVHPLFFAAGQLAALLPALLPLGAMVARRAAPAAERPPALDRFDRRYLVTLALGPGAVLLLGSAITGRGLVMLWGYPLWLFVPLLAVALVRPALDATALRRFAILWAAVLAVMAGAFIASNAVLPAYDHRYRAIHFPGRALAEEITARWRAATGEPLAYVVGPMWPAGNVAAFSPDHPRAFVDGDARGHPWIDVADLERRGAIVIYRADGADRPHEPAFLARAEAQPPLVLGLIGQPGDTVAIGFAILRPQGRPDGRP
jgi:4-amino-4-deoxy-L-arabinose transferase-like glycosyltransferase